MSDPLKEPEEYISAIKYLSELIQQDLNFGRKETIPARVNAIVANAIYLQKLYVEPEPAKEESVKTTAEEATEHYQPKGYSSECPTRTGLYLVVCGESDWTPNFVAITRNDYQMLVVHCPDIGERSVEQYHDNLEGTMWLRAA
jgi:hypothetical protein